MNQNTSLPSTFNWRSPFASAYFRSAGGYLGLKLVIFSSAGLVSQYLLTHYLARDDYGLLIWVGTIIALLGPFGLPGISTSITGAVAKGFDGNFRRGTWLEMAGGTLGGMVLLGLAGYYWFWTNDPTKAQIFVVAGVLGPGLWLDTHQCYWNGKKNFRALFWWAVPVRLLQLLSTAIVLYYSHNPVLVFSLQTAIQVAANVIAAIGIMKLSGINRQISEEYQSFGWFSTRLYWLGTIAAHLDKVIIGIFFGLESLAVFAVGELLYTYLYKTPATFLSQIFMPRLAEMNVNQAAWWVRNRQFYLIGVMVILVVIIGIAIPIVYPILFSLKYKDSIYYAFLFLTCIALGSPTFVCGAVIKSHAMKKETVMSWALLTFTPIVLLPIFSWLWGLTGIVATRGVTNLVISSYYMHMIRRLSNGNI